MSEDIRVIRISLPDELFQTLTKEAAARGISITELIRRGVVKELNS